MYDIVFVGHICQDEVVHFNAEPYYSVGSAVLFGSTAAKRVGRRVAVVTKLSTRDDALLEHFGREDIDVYRLDTEHSTQMRIVHPSKNIDERQMFQQRSAGFFTIEEMPPLPCRHMHLAGISDREFDIPFITAMRERVSRLSIDMQSLVRQVDPVSREIRFGDAKGKQQVTALMDIVKMDGIEAEILTGCRDLEQAACLFEKWGCPEVMITHAQGVLVRVQGKTLYERFTNKSTVGRNGRGDTTFGGYLSWRLENDAAIALRFAAALASLKMETPEPFAGSANEVLMRMKQSLDRKN